MSATRFEHNKYNLTSNDIINYMKQCKEEDDDSLHICLLINNKEEDKEILEYKITWPDINEIINNNYDNIQVYIECSNNEFYCDRLIIENYDDSYYEEDRLSKFYNNTINRMFLRGFHNCIIFRKCYAFNTAIGLYNKEINDFYGITIHIEDSSYIDNIKLCYFNNIEYLLVKNGSSINTLELVECIVKYGMYYIEYDKKDGENKEDREEERHYYNNDKSINNNGMNNIIINRLRLNKSIVINNYDSYYDNSVNNINNINDNSISVGLVNDNSNEDYNNNSSINNNYYIIHYDLWNISKYNRICLNNNNIRYIDSIYSINKE